MCADLIGDSPVVVDDMGNILDIGEPTEHLIIAGGNVINMLTFENAIKIFSKLRMEYKDEYNMSDKKQQILDLVKDFIKEKQISSVWKPGEWIQYSGPFFDGDEYTAAIDSLLNGWFILGEKGREFELKFAPFLGKKDGVVVNSGSSANLLMVSLLKTKRFYLLLKTIDLQHKVMN
jgi:hypothetical protein